MRRRPQQGMEPGEQTAHAPPAGTSRERPCLRVLVPVDGSAGASRAVAHAIDLVRFAGAVEVHIANMQPALTYVETLVAAPQVLAEYWSNVAGQEAVRPARSLLESAGVVPVVHLERGELPDAIEAIARRIGCDLIVMGTRGMGAVGNLLLGSVAAGVVRCADRPVTLVK